MEENGWLKKYQIIVNNLSREIRKGKYCKDKLIPSETKLMQAYAVSRITARKALDTLVGMGLIYKIQGKGCYIMESKKSHSLLKIHSYTEEIINSGMTPSRKIFTSSVSEATQEVSSILNIPEKSKVFVLERVVYADDNALCLVKSSLPYDRFPHIEFYDFSQFSLYEILKSYYKLEISQTILKVDTFSADHEIAEKMGEKLHVPLLYLSIIAYCIYHKQEIPIEFSQSYYNPKIISYTINQSS
ncbi:MAG: GntR family transcriptional regulator [Brevinema sp.]